MTGAPASQTGLAGPDGDRKPSASALSGSIPSAAWREGPWHARQSVWRDYDARKPIFDDGLWVVCQEDRFKVPVATIDSGDDHSAVTRERAEYTARLIAAAPELYEGLDKAIARLETIRVRLCRLSAHDGTKKAELVDYIRQCEAEADALLIKARGEQVPA